MKRPWQVWLAFAVCGAVVAAAMGWLTVHALRVDRERSVARAEVELEQNVSLALWRMDTKLAPLIAEEATRPHELYESFIAVSTPMAKGESAEELVPSPLLTKAPENVVLNFFMCPTTGDWGSPQAPPMEQLDVACANGLPVAAAADNRRKLDQLASAVNVAELMKHLPTQPMPSFGGVPVASAWSDGSVELEDVNGAPQTPWYFENYGELNASTQRQELEALEPQRQSSNDGEVQAEQGHQYGYALSQESEEPQQAVLPLQQLRAANVDFNQRGVRYQQAAQQEFQKQRTGNPILSNVKKSNAAPAVEYVSRPIWVGDELLLARRVDRDGQTFVQGSWLDWSRLKRELLTETADIVPGADLAPVRSDAEANPTRMLAGLPVKLVTAAPALALDQSAVVDGPLQWALSFGWLALALALGAVALLLWGVLALSERRAAFVSSVTHELRTPLTTFRMYAEMLARDMVPSPERRREYMETLKTEAERLTHLVENVLSYARLERGRRPQRSERTTPAALVERFESRLADRAAQAGMALACEVDARSSTVALTTDVGVVEQILFNLVDNAAKYASRAAERRIVLSAARDDRFVNFSVRDFGPGFVSPQQASRMAPFRKSAEEAAESAPGVGLGLALCRRLAAELGGRLEVASCNGEPGAVATLRLPVG